MFKTEKQNKATKNLDQVQSDFHPDLEKMTFEANA